MANRNLTKFFQPKSIAVIGASQDTRKVSTTIITNLLSSGYEGRIFPVNPKYKSLLGMECFKSLSSIPHRVDLAIMAIPSVFTKDVLKDCNKSGVKNLVVISAGYSEIGPEGEVLEEELRVQAEKYGVDVIGPNCLGIIVPAANMNASFAASTAQKGDIAFLSQSGAVCTAILDMSNAIDLGFSHFVSIGNKAVINENDLIENWLKDPEVKVMGAYLEEFADGYDFCVLKERVGIEKPIVVLNPGTSNEAKKAISSHTGSIATSKDISNAAMNKYGITQSADLREMYSLLYSFSKLPNASKYKSLKNIAVITNAGGPGILATDLLVQHGLKLAKLSKETEKVLKKSLPDSASVGNPVDILGEHSF